MNPEQDDPLDARGLVLTAMEVPALDAGWTDPRAGVDALKAGLDQ